MKRSSVLLWLGIVVASCAPTEIDFEHAAEAPSGSRSIVIVRRDSNGGSALEELLFEPGSEETDDLRSALAWACDGEIEASGFDASFISACDNPTWLQDDTVNLTPNNWYKNSLRRSCVAGHLMTIATMVGSLYIYWDDDGDGEGDAGDDYFVSPIAPDSENLPDHLAGLANPIVVPPQNPSPQGTAALLAFDELQTSVAWTGLVLNPGVCTDDDLDEPGLVQRLAATLSESLMNLEEAAQTASDRMMTMAEARRSDEIDITQGTALSWRARTDSRLDAARIAMLVPNDLFEGGTGLGAFPVVTAAPQSVAQVRAYNLLRRARVNPTLRGDALRDAVVAAMNADSPSGTPAFESPEGLMAAYRLTAQDLDRAMMRHSQELAALGLEAVPDPTVESGPVRYLNLDRSPRRVPWAYSYALAEGKVALSEPVADGLSTDYARRGFAHALDFAHYVVFRIRERDLGSAQPTIDTLWAWLESQVQDRARVCHVPGGRTGPPYRYHVTFHDVPVVTDDDHGAGRYRVFRGEAGLECAMHGTIGGVDCDPSDYEVDTTTSIVATPSFNDYGPDRAIVEILNPGPLEGQRIYFTWDQDLLAQSRKLLLGLVLRPAAQRGPADDFEWGAGDDDEDDRRFDSTFTVRVAGGSRGGEEDEERTTRDEGVPPPLDCHFIPLGLALQNTLQVLEPDPSFPAESRMSCAGVPGDVQVKLEDEVTEMFSGRDEIESSVATSLRTARASADEAERLGEALFQAHLAADERQSDLELREIALHERMNEVAGKLTGLCGGYIDPVRLIEAACDDDEVECDLAAFITQHISDEQGAIDLAESTESDLWGLRSCLGAGPEEPAWVAVGERDLCAYQPAGYPVCTCLQSDCPPCPVIVDGTASQESCIEVLGLDEEIAYWGMCSSGAGEDDCESGTVTLADVYQPHPITENLGINAVLSEVNGLSGCQAIANEEPAGGLDGISEALICQAEAYNLMIDGLYMADNPLDLTRDLQSGAATGVFPAHRGQYGETVAAVGGELLNLAQLSAAVSQQLVQAQYDVQALEIKLNGYELQDELDELDYQEQLSVQAAECVAAIAISVASTVNWRGFPKSVAEAAATCLIGTLKAGFAAQRRSLQERLSGNAQAQALIAAVQELAGRLDTISNLTFALRGSFAKLEQQMIALEHVRSEARRVINQLGLLQQQEAHPDAVINRAYSLRIDRLQYQYDEAMRRAKRDALISLRTIEQRIGMDLSLMNEDMAFGLPAPQTWVHRICSTSGLDYDRLLDEETVIPEGYDPADGHIGEVVSLLEDFLESYRYDYPFQDHDDTLVVSLREDILGLVDWCEQPTPNVLLGSGALDSGWTSGCSATQCGVVASLSAPTFDFPGAAAAVSVYAAAIESVPSMGVAGSGNVAIEQVVMLEAGEHTLSWYAPDGNELDAFIENAASGAAIVPTVPQSCPPGAGSVWGRCQLVIDLAAPLEVVVGFTLTDSSASLLAPQLEAGFGASAQFYATDADLTSPYLCASDGNGGNLPAAMSQGVEYYCPEGTALDCASTGFIDPAALPQRRYLSIVFPMDLALIESGAMMSRTGFALGNFNYRYQRVGVWVDGGPTSTFCPPAEPGIVSSCHADTHINWSLFHSGPFRVRNHENDSFDARLFPGVIRQARGAISSGPLRDPISQSDGTLQPAIEALMVDMNGRPFEGNIELRIYDEDRLNLAAIRDIQLVIDYSYWTRESI